MKLTQTLLFFLAALGYIKKKKKKKIINNHNNKIVFKKNTPQGSKNRGAFHELRSFVNQPGSKIK